MLDNIKTVLVGASGFTASEFVNTALSDPSQIQDIFGVITQVVIAIATLIGLFKRKKDKQEEEQINQKK